MLLTIVCSKWSGFKGSLFQVRLEQARDSWQYNRNYDKLLISTRCLVSALPCCALFLHVHEPCEFLEAWIGKSVDPKIWAFSTLMRRNAQIYNHMYIYIHRMICCISLYCIIESCINMCVYIKYIEQKGHIQDLLTYWPIEYNSLPRTVGPTRCKAKSSEFL